MGPSTVSFGRRRPWLLDPKFFLLLTSLQIRGYCGLPSRWIAIQALLASIMGASHGWFCAWTFSLAARVVVLLLFSGPSLVVRL